MGAVTPEEIAALLAKGLTRADIDRIDTILDENADDPDFDLWSAVAAFESEL